MLCAGDIIAFHPFASRFPREREQHQINKGEDVRDMAAYRLGIELLGTDSPVRRTVLVPGHASFADLHSIIQTVMQWGDYEYHSFYVGYDYDADGDDDMFTQISDYAGREIRYLYEPDAGWEVSVTWKGETDDDLGFTPVLEDWEGDAPPEGCYDMDDFRRFLKAYGDPDSPDRPEYASMFDGWEFDAEVARSNLRVWGVQGVMPEDAAVVDSQLRMDAVMMLASLTDMPVAFDRVEGRFAFVGEDRDIPDCIDPSDLESDPDRSSVLADDPYGLFSELVDGFATMQAGKGVGVRDPGDVLEKMVETEEDEDAWNTFVLDSVSDLVFSWARDNNVYFRLLGAGSEEGEVF